MKTQQIFVLLVSIVFNAAQATATTQPYCLYSPDTNCYEAGWPSCCQEGNNCPQTQPLCDLGKRGYCTYAPDKSCYQTGWPSCCSNNPVNCPVAKPDCDITHVTGGDYCTEAPDTDCYFSGWPICCSQQPHEEYCPTTKPSCEIAPKKQPVYGADYCTEAPDKTCYVTGWPACCSADDGNGSKCPGTTKPSCELLY